ncbi:MAG TPA: diacylglycerol kinase family lipid kinase [Anaerolineae bacterium]|nr:diacylglycerol kinase family lipid kinase [Anaerolineae bacterium]
MKAQLILNPAAGYRGALRDLQQAIEHLEGRGWGIALRETRGRGDATTYAREAVAAGCQAVVVVGGNGTINEAVNGLAGSDVALGVLPMGTGNVWAAEIGLVPIPTPLHRPDLLASARALTKGRIRRVDLGRAGDRYFLLWAGVGIDAQVTQGVEAEPRVMKRRLGPWAYGLAGLAIAWSFVGTRATLLLDGQEVRHRVILILISNAQLYAGMMRVAAKARLDDGLLDVCCFKGHGFLSTLRHLASVVTRHHLRDPQVAYYRARRIVVRTSRPLPVQVDGDPIGATPMAFEVVPRALKVILPPNAPQELFESQVA